MWIGFLLDKDPFKKPFLNFVFPDLDWNLELFKEFGQRHIVLSELEKQSINRFQEKRGR